MTAHEIGREAPEMVSLYITYSAKIPNGTSMGRTVLSVSGPERKLSFADVLACEKAAIEAWPATEPKPQALFLTGWEWLASDPRTGAEQAGERT